MREPDDIGVQIRPEDYPGILRYLQARAETAEAKLAQIHSMAVQVNTRTSLYGFLDPLLVLKVIEGEDKGSRSEDKVPVVYSFVAKRHRKSLDKLGEG